jgi:hypothetical protein
MVNGGHRGLDPLAKPLNVAQQHCRLSRSPQRTHASSGWTPSGETHDPNFDLTACTWRLAGSSAGALLSPARTISTSPSELGPQVVLLPSLAREVLGFGTCGLIGFRAREQPHSLLVRSGRSHSCSGVPFASRIERGLPCDICGARATEYISAVMTHQVAIAAKAGNQNGSTRSALYDLSESRQLLVDRARLRGNPPDAMQRVRRIAVRDHLAVELSERGRNWVDLSRREAGVPAQIGDQSLESRCHARGGRRSGIGAICVTGIVAHPCRCRPSLDAAARRPSFRLTRVDVQLPRPAQAQLRLAAPAAHTGYSYEGQRSMATGFAAKPSGRDARGRQGNDKALSTNVVMHKLPSVQPRMINV